MRLATLLGIQFADDNSRTTEAESLLPRVPKGNAGSIPRQDCQVARVAWETFIDIGPGGSVLRILRDRSPRLAIRRVDRPRARTELGKTNPVSTEPAAVHVQWSLLSPKWWFYAKQTL
jgi:hypothetical protein